MLQLFKAINHCHANGVVHRDIKPENIMVTDSDDVRLIDFGLGKVQRGKHLNEVAGTPLYMAPEVIQGSYGKEADMWSLGVLLFTLVSGYLPFYAKSTNEVFAKIKQCKWTFPSVFNKVSPECKDLITKLLVSDPK